MCNRLKAPLAVAHARLFFPKIVIVKLHLIQCRAAGHIIFLLEQFRLGRNPVDDKHKMLELKCDLCCIIGICSVRLPWHPIIIKSDSTVVHREYIFTTSNIWRYFWSPKRRLLRFNLSPDLLAACFQNELALKRNYFGTHWSVLHVGYLGHVSVGSWPAGEHSLCFDCAVATTSHSHRKHRSPSNTPDLRAVNWSLPPIRTETGCKTQKDAATAEQRLHLRRQVSWPELLKQVWSNNRLPVSSLLKLVMRHHMVQEQDVSTQKWKGSQWNVIISDVARASLILALSKVLKWAI